MRASLLDSLDDFEHWGDDTAYVFPRGYRHERWSYSRVAGLAYQVGRELMARNIGKGDAALLWSPNSAEWVATFLGCALCGVIAVPVDDAASPDFAQRICGQVRTKLVFCSRERAAFFENVGSAVCVDSSNLSEAVSGHSPTRFRPLQIQPSDTLEIVFTSGTTADPKGVVLTHGNVAGNLAPIEAEIGKYLKYERWVHPIRFLNLLPLSHVFGQFLGIFLPPLLGGTVVFTNTFNPAEIMATIRRERVSVLVAVPRMMDSLKQKLERDADPANVLRVPGRLGAKRAESRPRSNMAGRLRFLRRWWTFRDVHHKFGWKFWALISGGAALENDTEEFWQALGYVLIQGYGLTETTSLISLNHPFHTSRGSIGKVLPGREIKLAEDGEILVRGSGVAGGYWSSQELHPLADDEGWYPTGDLGALDERGNLFFKGRKKDVIVTAAGMNIYPEDLEAVLRRQPEVRDCVVVGLERGGNAEPCAVVIPRHREASEVKTDVKMMVARANETLAEYQRMRAWFVWPDEDFPRSSTQKARRNQIREVVASALQERVTQGEGDRSTRPLIELLTRITGRAAPDLTAEDSLDASLRLSSLERVELVAALEDRYQVDLNETKFAEATTVGEIEQLIQGRRGAGRKSADARFHYPRWALRWPASWLRLAAHYLLVRPAVLLLGRPRIVGLENLRSIAGPVLVISNHIADVDIGFIQFTLPGRIRHRLATAAGGEALEKLRSPSSDRAWILRIYDRAGWMLGVALLNLFPLPRLSGFRKSFAYAGEAVDRGYSVLVFPEGRYTEDGGLGPFQAGIGLLANNLAVPIIPVRIHGLFEVKKAGKRFAAPGKIQVHFGEPIAFAPGTDPEEIARVLRERIERL